MERKAVSARTHANNPLVVLIVLMLVSTLCISTVKVTDTDCLEKTRLSSSDSELETQTDEVPNVNTHQRADGFYLDLLESRDFTQSNSSTAFSEDFEGAFPADNWSVGDENSNNGLDYWDDTSYRSQAGNWSGWCAQIGSQTSTATILDEDFEGVFPGSWTVEDFDSASGSDLWDDTSYRSNDGSWSAWCAEIGTKVTSTTTIFYEDFEGAWPGSWSVFDSNEASDYDYWGDYYDTIHPAHQGSWDGYCADEGAHPGCLGYDNNMDAYMYRSVNLAGYTSVTLSYYYWLDSESGYDYLYVAYFDGSWHDIDAHSGNSNGWQYSSISIPTSATQVGLHFHSDSSVCNYNGAFVDEVQLTGIIEGPNYSVHEYDNDMETYMYHAVSLSGYSSVTLSYYYWLDSESGYDYLYVAYFDGSWHDIDAHSGNSGGWQYSSISIPTSASYVGFHFSSDVSVCNYEGAYIDRVILTGVSDIPNTSLNTYDHYMDAYMVRKYTIDASTWVSAALYYWAWYETESSFDYCQVIVTDDAGAHWYYIGTQLTGSSGWSYHSLPIPGTYLTSLFNIGFKFHSDGSVHYEGVYLDNIILEYELDTTPPPAPVISSPTHTNEDEWFSNNDPAFEWTTPSDPSGIEGYSYTLDHSPSTTPDETVDTTGNSRSYVDIADSELWFHVRAKDNADNWGAADHYRIRVDTTPPSTLITHVPGSYSVYLEAADPTPGSGVYAINVRIDGGAWTEYLSAGVEIPLAGTGSHFIETYSKDNANPRNSESPFKTLTVNYLTVNTNPPGLDNPTGQGWYDLGTQAYVNVDNVAAYTFEYWYLDGQVGTPYSTSMSTSKFMDGPHTLTAKFQALIHDVAVINILPLKTVVYQGHLMSINVTVENQGDYTETFSVTVKCDLTLIDTKTAIDLAPEATQTLTFNWNTTGFTPANYTISAVADTVPGETDLADNTYVDGWVIVAILGDVNLDGIVDIYDGVLVAAAVGARLITDPEDPRFGEYWHDEPCSRCPHNPLADINQDGIIDNLDLKIVEENLGRTE